MDYKSFKKNGFTLAELLVVVAIIGVLVAIAIPVFAAQLDSSKAATCLANRRSMFAEVRTTAMSSNQDESAVFTTLYSDPDRRFTCPDNGTWTYAEGDILCSVAGHEPILGSENIDINNPTPGSMGALLSAVSSIFDTNLANINDISSNSQRTLSLQDTTVNGQNLTALLNEAFGENIFAADFSNMFTGITAQKSANYSAEGNPIEGLVCQVKDSNEKNHYYLYYGADVYDVADYGDLKAALKGSGTTKDILDTFVKDSNNATKVS